MENNKTEYSNIYLETLSNTENIDNAIEID